MVIINACQSYKSSDFGVCWIQVPVAADFLVNSDPDALSVPDIITIITMVANFSYLKQAALLAFIGSAFAAPVCYSILIVDISGG